jgi:hypothetical protein
MTSKERKNVRQALLYRMIYFQIVLIILTIFATSMAMAEDFKTVNGKEYKNATVSRVEPDGIVLKSKSGIAKVYFIELPKEVQQRFNFDPVKAAQFNADIQSAVAQVNAATPDATPIPTPSPGPFAESEAVIHAAFAKIYGTPTPHPRAPRPYIGCTEAEVKAYEDYGDGIWNHGKPDDWSRHVSANGTIDVWIYHGTGTTYTFCNGLLISWDKDS